VTPQEFDGELVRLGFRQTAMTAGLLRRWIHASGEVRWIMDPQYLLAERRAGYIATVRRSIGL
jgi:hypothetical protein